MLDDATLDRRVAVSRARGQSGDVRVGGRMAATLGPWRMRRESGAFTVTAAVVASHPVWAHGVGPYELRLDMGRCIWRYCGVSIQIEGERIVIEGAGSPEVI